MQTSERRFDEIVASVETALERTVAKLFREHRERFYFISLNFFEGGGPPIFSAWSEEALASYCRDTQTPPNMVKWSYADSPYYDFGSEFFTPVEELFWQCDPGSEQDAWLSASEEAVARLDARGVFGIGEERLRIALTVEVQPPDHTNAPVVMRLNPPEAIRDWLREACESTDDSFPV